MKTQHQKLKNPPRPLFSCGIFNYCTEPVLSPTNPPPPPTPTFPPPPSSHPPPPPLPPRPVNPSPQPESESSSSSSTSQSFTQWRFPLPNSPMLLTQHPPFQSTPIPTPEIPHEPNPTPPPQVLIPYTSLAELFHVAELQFSSSGDSDATRLSTLYLLERSLVPNPPADGGKDPTCPPAVMGEVVSFLKDNEGAKPATKVLLALCLSEANRHVAVEAGAVVEVLEALPELEGATAERALAALELLCTIAEGAAELRAHALAVPMLIQIVGRMMGRGKECAISILATIFSGGAGGGGGGEAVELPEEAARAVLMALQGECSARGRRKGTQLLKSLQENGRLDFMEEGIPMMMNYGP